MKKHTFNEPRKNSNGWWVGVENPPFVYLRKDGTVSDKAGYFKTYEEACVLIVKYDNSKAKPVDLTIEYKELLDGIYDNELRMFENAPEAIKLKILESTKEKSKQSEKLVELGELMGALKCNTRD